MAGELTLQELLVKIGADASQYRSTLDGARRHLQQWSTGMDRLGTRLTVGLSAPMVAVGAGALKMAIAARESESMVSVSFGKMEGSARKWSEGLRDELGQNAYAVRKQAATMNTMLKSMGLSEDQAYKLSTSLVELGADLESFFDLSSGEGFAKLRAGIAGEAEPLKQLGILVNENTVKQTALQYGLIQTGEVMTEQQKVMARYLTIMNATADAQGDLARTAESPANQIRRLKNQMAETAIELGNALLPALEAALPTIKSLADRLAAAATAFANMSPEARKTALTIAGLLIAAGPMLKVGASLTSTIGSAAGALGKLTEAAKKAKAAKAALTVGTSANVQAMAAAAKSAAALKAGLVGLAAAAGVAIGTAIRPWVNETLGLADAMGLVADKQTDWTDELTDNKDLYLTNLELYNKMREKLGMLGDEYLVTADHTEANARRLARLSEEVRAAARATNTGAEAQRNLGNALASTETIAERLRAAMARQDKALADVASRTRELYGVISKKEAEEQMRRLVADFALLASEGVSAEQIVSKFGPSVEELADVAKQYRDIDTPDDFRQLAHAIGKGKDGALYYVSTLADQMKHRVPEGAEQAKQALEGTIAEGMANAKGTVDAESSAILETLRQMAEHEFSIDVHLNADTEALQRQLAAAGVQPDTGGTLP